jgi:hypothetical protein
MNLNPIILHLNFEDIRPSYEEVVTAMGYVPGAEPSFLPDILETLMEEAVLHTEAAGCFRIFKVENVNIKGGWISFSDGIIHCGRKIAAQLKGAEYLGIFLATAGQSFESWIKSKKSDGDIMSEFLCSSIGSEIADKAADQVESEIKKVAEGSGMGITNRYSPGYCDWSVKEQEIIFRLLPASGIGVSLTSSFLMSPVKSVSGIIGLGHGIRQVPYACELCSIEDCIVKRARGK